MSYYIDRNAKSQPSLTEMTRRALEILHSETQDSPFGFFLLVEGSLIDSASHSNDPIAHLHDVLEFNSAFEVARRFIEQVGGILISTSDYESGGLSLGRDITPKYPEYKWLPEVLRNAIHSTRYLAIELVSNNGLFPCCKLVTLDPDVQKFIENTIMRDGLGIDDATEEEIRTLIAHRSDASFVDRALADMISQRAQIGVSLA